MLSSQCQHDQTQDNLNKKKMHCFITIFLAPECVNTHARAHAKRTSTLLQETKAKQVRRENDNSNMQRVKDSGMHWQDQQNTTYGLNTVKGKLNWHLVISTLIVLSTE